MPVLGGSSGGGGAVTEVSAVADGAVANGSPVIQLGDGKIATVAGNIAAHTINNGNVTSSINNQQYYAFYNAKTFVNRAAGRGICLAQMGSGYNYRAISKLFNVNTTTGAFGGSGMTSSNFSYPVGSATNYMQYPQGAIWDSATSSWFFCYRKNSSGSYNLVMGKEKTTTGYSHASGYKHNFGSANQYAIYSSYTGTTRFIEARGYKYVITCGNTQAYGRDSCMVHGPFTWSSDANDGGAFAGTALATDYASYNVSADAIYDSANQQIVVVTSKSTTSNDQSLYAFDVAANGTVTYSHGLLNAGGDVAGQIRSISTNTSGDIVWSELNSKKIYAAKNTGSAFTKGNTLAWPSGVYAQVSMAYNPTYKTFLASYASSSGYTSAPTHLIFSVASGTIGGTTQTSIGTGAQYGSYSSYAGYEDNPTSSFKMGGNYVDTTDTFYQYNYGNADSNTTSEFQSNQIATSNAFTGAYIGLAKAAISNGASGKITTKGAINESQTGLAAGSRYSVTSSGTVKTESSLTEAEEPTAIFLGTATATDSILVGDTLQVQDDSATHNDVPKSISFSGTGFTSAYSTDAWTGVINRYNLNTENVSATGTNSIFRATGSGTVLFFVIAGTSQQSTNLKMFIDGIQILETGSVTSGPNYPINLIGEFGGVNTNKHGNPSPTTAFNFNKSFEVKNNNGTATSFSLAYKILGN